MNKICPKCGISIEGNFSFCPQCGTALIDASPIVVTSFKRMNRKPYFWYTFLINFLLQLAIQIAALLASRILIVLTLVVFVIVFSWLSIRRSHDLNKPGYFAVIAFIPLACLYLYFKRGTIGPNQYGPDPIHQKLG